MLIYHRINDFSQYRSSLVNAGHSIGFVPTMGALHQGHVSLLQKSKQQNDITMCSVFVNPIQFNNAEDFAKYPIQHEKDLEMLLAEGCDVVLLPTKEEMYPPHDIVSQYCFGSIESVMEGAYRPGHFNGVAVVVKKLFDIFMPDKAYFGEKDFQQLQIIKALVKHENMDITIIPCPIVRESDGLAMSSRNMRLSPHERCLAPKIFQTMTHCASLTKEKSVDETKNIFLKEMANYPEFQMEYFEIADESTLQPVCSWNEAANIRVFVAVFLGNVRLIDNMKIIL